MCTVIELKKDKANVSGGGYEPVIFEQIKSPFLLLIYKVLRKY